MVKVNKCTQHYVNTCLFSHCSSVTLISVCRLRHDMLPLVASSISSFSKTKYICIIFTIDFLTFQVASMFWYNFHCKMCIGYNVLALMAEINSFFLHSRKLLHMLNFDFDNKFYRAVCIVNLLTFFFCRGWSLCKISYGMATEYHRVPVFYFRCLTVSIFVMNMISPVLFWRLFKNDILRNLLASPKKSKHMVNGNNNKNTHIKLD